MGTLSPAEFCILELYTRAATSLGSVSGYWDKYNKKLQNDDDPSRKRTRHIIFIIYLLGCVLWAVASGYRIHNAFSLSPEKFHVLLKMVYIFLFIIPFFSALSLWPFAYFREHFPAFLNHQLVLSNKFGKVLEKQFRNMH